MVTVQDAPQTINAAAFLRARGFALCKPDPGTKCPTYPRWGCRSLEATDFADTDLIGVIGGPLSDCNRPGLALVAVDLDDAEAIRLADVHLPSTGMMEGRAGKPNDHRYFLVPLDSVPEWALSTAEQAAAAAVTAKGHAGPFKKAFNHAETKKRLIDFIGAGGQIVCPSPGNARQWAGGEPGEPAVVPFADLWDSVCRLAVACGAKAETTGHDPSRNGQASQPGRIETDAKLLRRIIAYLEKCDPAVSGQNGHDTTYWPARVVCYGFDRGAAEGFRILLQHFNPRCLPPWTDAELMHKCQDADTLSFSKPRGWLLADNHDAKDRCKNTGKTFTIGPLSLIPGQPRQTASGRITLPVNVEMGGRILYPFILSNAASGRKEPTRVVKQLLGEDPAVSAIDEALTGLLAYAAEKLANRQAAEGPTIARIVGDKVPEALQLVCRTKRGAWSESRGAEITRADFVTFVPSWLADECAKAADTPRDAAGQIARSELIHSIQVELGVLWSDLLSTLPAEADAEIGENTEKGRAFRQALIHLWKTPVTWEKQQTASGDTASRASMASRVLSDRQRRQGEPKWHPIHSACDAWWRDWTNPEGEIETLLAMRWTLARQVGIDLPAVVDEASLTRLGLQFHVLQKPPEGIPSRLSGGTHRLAVLSLDMCHELLEQPTEDIEDNPREPGT